MRQSSLLPAPFPALELACLCTRRPSCSHPLLRIGVIDAAQTPQALATAVESPSRPIGHFVLQTGLGIVGSSILPLGFLKPKQKTRKTRAGLKFGQVKQVSSPCPLVLEPAQSHLDLQTGARCSGEGTFTPTPALGQMRGPGKWQCFNTHEADHQQEECIQASALDSHHG